MLRYWEVVLNVPVIHQPPIGLKSLPSPLSQEVMNPYDYGSVLPVIDTDFDRQFEVVSNYPWLFDCVDI